MLNLQLATGYVDLTLDRRQYDAQLQSLLSQLSGLRPPPIPVTMNVAPATAALNALAAQLSRVTRQAANLAVGRGGGFGFGGRGGGAGFMSGLASGLGMPLMLNPAMAGGALVGRGIAGAVSGVTGAVGGAMDLAAGQAKNAVEAAASLEHQFSQLRKTSGATGETFTRLRRDIVTLATTMKGVSFDELLATATMAGRLGIASDSIAAFTRDIAMIRVALDGIPAEEAGTHIARILNNFKLGSQDAIRFASALNKLDDSTTATGRDILDVTQRLAGPASTLGLSPQKMLALAAAMKDAGIQNSVAGTAFTQVMTKMAVSAESFAAIAGHTKESFSKLVDTDALQALTDFASGLSKLKGPAQLQVLNDLGLRGGGVKTSLSQLASVLDRLPSYISTAENEWRSLASIQSEYAIQSQTTNAVLQQTSNIVQAAGGSIGESLLPVVKEAAVAFGALAMQVAEAFARNRETIDAWAGQVGGAIRMVGVAFKQWPDTVEAATKSINPLLEALLQNIRNYAPFITKVLVAGFMDAYTAIETITLNFVQNWAADLANGLKGKAGTVLGAINPAAALAIKQLGDVPKVPLTRGVGLNFLPDALKGAPKPVLPDLGPARAALDRLAAGAAQEKQKADARALLARPDVAAIREQAGKAIVAALTGDAPKVGDAIAKAFDQAMAKAGAPPWASKLIGVLGAGASGGAPGLLGFLASKAPPPPKLDRPDLEDEDEEGGGGKRKKGGGAKAPKERHLSVGTSMLEYGRRVQEEILNSAKDRDEDAMVGPAAEADRKVDKAAKDAAVDGKMGKAIDGTMKNIAERTARATEESAKTLEQVLEAIKRLNLNGPVPLAAHR